MIKFNYWLVFWRYREFDEFYKKLVKFYGIFKDMLLLKKFILNMVLLVFEKRKVVLEYYLQ